MNDTSPTKNEERDPNPNDEKLGSMDFFPIKNRVLGDRQIYAVNFDYILKTGKIPMYSNIGNVHAGYNTDIKTTGKYNNHHIDISEDDTFIRVLNRIISDVEKDMRSKAKKLLADEHWDKNDRQEWERMLAETTSHAVHATRGLENARSDDLYPGKRHIRATYINNIINDIKNGTQNHELDCEVYSIIKGYVMQSVENRILDEYVPLLEPGSWKKPMNYFYAGCGVTFSAADKKPGAHAYIATPSGNVVEGTEIYSPYMVSKNGEYSLEKLAHGLPFISKNDFVYGGMQKVEHDLSRYESGFPDSKKSLSEALPDYNIAYNKKHQIFLAISKSPDDDGKHHAYGYINDEEATSFAHYRSLNNGTFYISPEDLKIDILRFQFPDPKGEENYDLIYNKDGSLEVELKNSRIEQFFDRAPARDKSEHRQKMSDPAQMKNRNFRETREQLCTLEHKNTAQKFSFKNFPLLYNDT